MKTTAELASELRKYQLADDVGLDAKQRSAILAAILRHKQSGRMAYVVEADRGRSLEELRSLWDELGLDERADLLLLHNGARWEARGWGLTPQQVSAALGRAEAGLKHNLAAGIGDALERLAAATGARMPDPSAEAVGIPAPEDEISGVELVGWGGASVGVLFLGGLGWVIARRRKLERERKRRIADALSRAELAQAEVVLAADELPGETGAEVQLRAARLGEELRRIADESKESESVVVGRLSQLESELNTLHSDVVTRARRGGTEGAS